MRGPAKGSGGFRTTFLHKIRTRWPPRERKSSLAEGTGQRDHAASHPEPARRRVGMDICLRSERAPKKLGPRVRERRTRVEVGQKDGERQRGEKMEEREETDHRGNGEGSVRSRTELRERRRVERSER